MKVLRRHIRTSVVVVSAGLLALPGSGRTRAQVNPALELLTHGQALELTLAQHEAAGGGPVKCGFGAVLAALSEGGRAASEVFDNRVPIYQEQTWTSPGGYFLIHYTVQNNPPYNEYDAVPTADSDGDGIPDYIETAAACLDSVRTWYLSRGWRYPVNDGNSTYDVYFIDLEAQGGYFGYTAPTEPYSIIPPYTAASYIVLDNDYPQSWYGLEPLASLRVTIAHEFNHALQLAYNNSLLSGSYQRYIWFAEASAVYHEEQIYDGINDYVNYTPYFLDYPQLTLTEYSSTYPLHMYGSVVWTLMLDGLFGADAVRDIWTVMATEPADPIEAHRVYLQNQGTDLIDTYATFTEWMLHTGDRAIPGSYYEEGATFSEVAIQSQDLISLDLTLPALATRYYRSPSATTSGGVALRLDPSQQAEWGVGIAGEASGGQLGSVATRTRVDAEPGEGTGIELFDTGTWNNIIRWSFAGDNFSLSTGSPLNRSAVFEAGQGAGVVSASASGSAFVLRQNYPNPFRPGDDETMYFAFDTTTVGHVKLEIRALSGALIWSHTFTALEAGSTFTDDLGLGWDGRDEQGNEAAAGVYLLLGTHDGTTRSLQFSVIR